MKEAISSQLSAFGFTEDGRSVVWTLVAEGQKLKANG
jgi:hypothetical protein